MKKFPMFLLFQKLAQRLSQDDAMMEANMKAYKIKAANILLSSQNVLFHAKPQSL
jgi:hypothetical protein